MYQYIIVGAGSAGCVLANRLSENPEVRVLLLEAGGKDWHPFIHMPAGLAKIINVKSINWHYYTEPEPNLNNRRMYWPRGKVLGGSSSINAMCYTRGQAEDYDQWAALGNPGWSYHEVLPYFKKAENCERGASEYHGVGGPLNVQDLLYKNPLSGLFIEAAASLGYPRNDDFSGAKQEGIGYYQVTQKNGQRCSAAVAYLNPIKNRPNLTILTKSLAHKVLFEGKRAIGVEYSRGRQITRALADKEVILSGGAINSPHVLLLSGIGPADQLKKVGIPVLQDLPGVGKNLQDHLDACTLYQCVKPITYDSIRYLKEIPVGIQYYLFRKGPGTSNIAEAGGFVRSPLAKDTRPDVQFHFLSALLDDHGRNRINDNGMTIHACDLRPESRGELLLKSARPDDKVVIYANYLSTDKDMAMMVAGVKMAREIFHEPSFNPYLGKELFPGAQANTDEAIRDFIRRKAETIYHPVGTCKMGTDDQAVVDPELKVRGIEHLRVVDASIMPTLLSGNTNAPAIMIAEKAADLMKAY
ncbi:MAG: GMC family oxidoreductase [Beggiatoa sp. IS2]|nr:MAG: GMC family oxidoreductase [Beggiatoa sp. IS2]